MLKSDVLEEAHAHLCRVFSELEKLIPAKDPLDQQRLISLIRHLTLAAGELQALSQARRSVTPFR